MSVSGERSNSISSSSANSRSSMSRNDMWQPKQPASEVVATLSFVLAPGRPCQLLRRSPAEASA